MNAYVKWILDTCDALSELLRDETATKKQITHLTNVISLAIFRFEGPLDAVVVEKARHVNLKAWTRILEGAEGFDPLTMLDPAWGPPEPVIDIRKQR